MSDKATLAGVSRSYSHRGYVNTLTVEPEGDHWRWSVWAYDAGRSGVARTAALAWRDARYAEDELRRSDAVARP